MVKAIVLGDLHFHTNNVKETNEFIEKILVFMSKNTFDFIVILGDVLHEHEKLHTTPLNNACFLINSLRKFAPLYILVGNHDMINHQQFLTTNHWMNTLKEWDNVIVVDKALHNKIQNKDFIFCPYVAPGRFVEALNTISDVEWKDADCIFAHQEFYGCKMGAIISTDGDKWSLDYPNIISGHIHSKQQIQKNIFYTGSSLQQAFGESEENIIADIEFDDSKDYILNEIDLNLTRKKILYMGVEDVESFELPETKDTLKLTLKGNYEQFKTLKKSKKYKELIKSGIKISYKHNRMENIDSIEENNEEENKDFNDVLFRLVINENNENLVSDYNHIFLGRSKNEDILLI